MNYKCDEAGTALNYEVISEAVCSVRAARPLGADWKRRIDEDVQKRGEIMNMYGAILGDIVGSPYEFDCNNYKGKDFPLFSQRSEFTDDTVMTLAVARPCWILADRMISPSKRRWCGRCSGWDVLIPTRATVRGSISGCMRMIRSRTAAMATAVPCGFLPRRGWQRVYKRRCIWRSSPPR